MSLCSSRGVHAIGRAILRTDGPPGGFSRNAHFERQDTLGIEIEVASGKPKRAV